MRELCVKRYIIIGPHLSGLAFPGHAVVVTIYRERKAQVWALYKNNKGSVLSFFTKLEKYLILKNKNCLLHNNGTNLIKLSCNLWHEQKKTLL